MPTGFADEIVISDHTFRSAHNKLHSAAEPPNKKRKREDKGDSSVLYGAGAYKGPWARFKEATPEESSGEEEVEVEYEEDEIEEQPTRPTTKAGTDYEGDGGPKETSEFHGESMYDYQGRTYMHGMRTARSSMKCVDIVLTSIQCH